MQVVETHVRLFCRRRRLQHPQAFAAAASRRDLCRACTKLVARAGRQALGALGASPWASRRRGEWLLGGGGSASSLRSCALLLVTPIERLLSIAVDEVAAPAGRRRLLMAAPRTAGHAVPPGLPCLAISVDESGSQLQCRCGGSSTAPVRGAEAARALHHRAAHAQGAVDRRAAPCGRLRPPTPPTPYRPRGYM